MNAPGVKSSASPFACVGCVCIWLSFRFLVGQLPPLFESVSIASPSGSTIAPATEAARVRRAHNRPRAEKLSTLFFLLAVAPAKVWRLLTQTPGSFPEQTTGDDDIRNAARD